MGAHRGPGSPARAGGECSPTVRATASRSGASSRRHLPTIFRHRSFLSASVLAVSISFATLDPSTAAIVRVDPNTMQVNNAVDNLFLVTTNARFGWVFPGPGTQTNWQIQVDSDPNFVSPLWFWDSGTGGKAGKEGDTNVPYGVPAVPTGNPSGTLLPVDGRANLIYWRLRVQSNSDPAWDDDPNDFSYGVFKLNQFPNAPAGMAAADDLLPGLIPGAVFPALNPAPKEFFVATNGDDANPGTQAQPFKTIGKGVTVLNPGDTLSIRAGTYIENVRVATGPTIKNGTPGNPITVRSFPGETATIRAATSGSSPFAPVSFVGAGGPVRHWTLDRVRLGGSGANLGVFINNSEFITVKNITFESTFNPGATGVQMIGGGDGNRVLNSTFDTTMFDCVQVGNSRHVEVRGNDMSKFTHSAVQVHVSGSQGSLVTDNLIHDGSPTAGALAFYLSADGAVARNNVFWNITKPTSGLGAAVEIIRSGKITVENNTMVNVFTGVQFVEWSRISTVRNNIIYGANTALKLDLARQSTFNFQFSTSAGTVIDHNYLFNNQNDITLAYPEDANMISMFDNCFGGPPSSPNPACDPKLVNVGAEDFHLGPGSPAIDAGDPNVTVPVGGGGVRDVGALEVGAAALPPYEYQPEAVLGDVTPRFTWSLVDADNVLNSLFPADFPDTDSQTALELQIDTVHTFDSVNGSRPVFATGVVVSPIEGYTVPDLNALTPGEYYVRVRQRDEHQVALGAWSDNDFRIRVVSEPQAPVLTQQAPAPGAVAVPASTSIALHVVDFGSGVDSSTIRMNIGVNDPGAPTAVTPQITQVGATPQDFAVSFTPSPGTFGSGDVVTVRIRASDLFGPPNALDTSYSFTISDATPPANPTGLAVVP